MSTPTESRSLLEQIVRTQRFAVLATLKNQQPYSNLVAFAVSDDLRHIIFATRRNTQKYRNILLNDKVALLIDNRTNSHSDFAKAMAITALGIASEFRSGENREWMQSYLERHQSLLDFAQGSDTAFICVTVTEYILARFDGVERMQVDSIF